MVKEIQSWQILVKRLPISIHNFCHRYLVMSLANNSNFKRWKISNSELCSLSTKKQTQLHVFNYRLQALNRYTWRHNSIIQTFCNLLLKTASYDFRLYADIEGFENPATLFKSWQKSLTTTGPQKNDLLHRARPDIAIETRDTLTVIELTCPYETNTTKFCEYKETRYKEIKRELLIAPSNFQWIFLEVISLGFVTKNIKSFRNIPKSINTNERYLIEKLHKVTIRCSYFIHCRRNKNWNEPNLISYEWNASNTNDHLLRQKVYNI